MSGHTFLVGAVAALLIAPIAASPATAQSEVAWSACAPTAPGESSLEGYLCATLKVPLNYKRPSGRQVTLGLVKHPAVLGSPRGTLLFNPGGPGDTGSAYLPALLGGFPARIVRSFGIVSWDPRGMGGLTTPVVQCFRNIEREEALFAKASFPPLNDNQVREFARTYANFNRHCRNADQALLRHVSTADNARDMDVIRQALGLQKIDYYGTSYGTFLGATYANMFPGKYRHMVLDGAIDPVAWAKPRGRLSTFIRAGSNVASAQTLQSFLRMCGSVSKDRCAFSAGTETKTVAKYERLIKATMRGVPTADGTLTANDVAGFTVGNLYLLRPAPGLSRFVGWPGLAQALQETWRSLPGRASLSAVQAYMGEERQPSVVCGESPNPRKRKAYLRQAKDSLDRFGVGSAAWTWIADCEDWPVKAADPHTGPWTNAKRPIVVIGTTGDPATPYSNAVSTAQLLPKGRLLTVKGQGHTALANPSACAQRRVAAYLLRDRLPGQQARPCRQDVRPFGP